MSWGRLGCAHPCSGQRTFCRRGRAGDPDL